jgi:hypothetical protein
VVVEAAEVTFPSQSVYGDSTAGTDRPVNSVGDDCHCVLRLLEKYDPSNFRVEHDGKPDALQSNDRFLAFVSLHRKMKSIFSHANQEEWDSRLVVIHIVRRKA